MEHSLPVAPRVVGQVTHATRGDHGGGASTWECLRLLPWLRQRERSTRAGPGHRGPNAQEALRALV